MKVNFLRLISIATVTILFVACGGNSSTFKLIDDQNNTGGKGSPKVQSKGTAVANKGPFIKGSVVTAYKLNNDGSHILDKVVTTKTLDDTGIFSIEIPWTGLTELHIEGTYLNELTGEYMNDGNLSSIINMKQDEKNEVGINLLTDISKKIIIGKMEKTPEGNFSNFEKEAKAVITDKLNLDENISFGTLDVTKTDNAKNIQLLEISSVVLGTDDPQAVVDDLVEALSNVDEDGELDAEGDSVIEELQEVHVDLDNVADNLGNNIDGLKIDSNLTNQRNGQLGLNSKIRFPRINNALLDTNYTSTMVTVNGIIGDVPATLSIDKGWYKINGSLPAQNATTIKNGDTLELIQTSSANYSTKEIMKVKIGKKNIRFVVKTISDKKANDGKPDKFTFGFKRNVPMNTEVTSDVVKITGINVQANISIDKGEYSINGGEYTSSDGTVKNDDNITVRLTTGNTLGQRIVSKVTIGTQKSGTRIGKFVVKTERKDRTPEISVLFNTISGVEKSTAVTSNSINVTDINVPIKVRIKGAEFSIDGGAFQSKASTIENNQSIRVRAISANSFDTKKEFFLNIGRVVIPFTIITKSNPVTPDTTPDKFKFDSVRTQEVSKLIESNIITVSSINKEVAISVTNGEYSINGGDYISTASKVKEGDRVQVRVTSATYGSEQNATLDIGGVTASFIVKTVKDETPDPIFFSAKLNVVKNTQVESDEVNITGINVPIPVSVVSSEGEYSIDGGDYTSNSGTISNNQRLRVRLNSANSANSSSVAVIKVGQMPLTFVTITQEDAPKFKTPIVAPHAIEDKKYKLELKNFLEEGVATSWSITGNPSWLTINSINGRLEGIPKGNDAVGSFPITVTAKNKTGESTVTFDLIVDDINYQPVLATLSNLSKHEDDKPFTVTLSSTDRDGTVGVYSATASNSKVTLAVVDNILTITPQKDAYGLVDITVTVTDVKGAKDSKTFTLDLASINDAPILDNLSPITVKEDSNPIEVPLNSSDVEGDKITYIATSSDESKLKTVVNGNRLKLIPQPNMNGLVTINVVANDGIDDSEPQIFTVDITPVNDAPILNVLSPVIMNEDSTPVEVILNATDIDNEKITYSVTENGSNNPATVTLSGSKLKITPIANAFGTMSITVVASDGKLKDSKTLIITVNAVNDAPILNALSPVTINEDASPVEVTLSSTDIENDKVTYKASSSDESKLKAVVSGNTLTLTPQPNMNGSVTVTVIANDGTDNSEPQTFKVTINPLNDAPTITGTPTTRAMEDSPYSFIPVGADIDDGTTLVYSIENNPTWAGFDSSTGALTGVPSANDIGTTTGIVISVSDGNLTASLPPFDLEVTHVNHEPTIEGDAQSTIAVGLEYSFIPTANDLDVNDTLTFSVENKPEWLDLNTTTGELSGIPEFKDIGEYGDIVLSVTDDMNTSSMTLSIQVFDDSNITALPISLPINLYAPDMSEKCQDDGNCTNMYTYENFSFDSTPLEFFREYYLDINGTFQQRPTSYMLNPTSGDWESEAIFGKTVKVNNDFIDVVDENVRIAVTNVTDISNQDVNISGLMVRFPSGAQKYTLNARGYGERHFIWEPKENYTTLEELMSATCEQEFITSKESENSVGLVPVGCSGTETEGLLEEHNSTDTLNSNAGHWVIKTVNNKEMLVIYPSISGYAISEEDNESLMFTEFDDGNGSKLWKGAETNRDGTPQTFELFNEIAMNAIKQKMLDAQLGIKFRFTRDMLANAETVWNVYPESNDTTGEYFWKSTTFEFTQERLIAQDGIVATVDNSVVDTNYSLTDKGQLVFLDEDNNLTYLRIEDMNSTAITTCSSSGTEVVTCSESDYKFVYFSQSEAQGVLDGLNANTVRLPDGYVYRVINNKGEEVNTTVEVDGTTYLIKFYANYEETFDRQKNHKAIRVTINGVQSETLSIQNTYVGNNIVAGIYLDERLIHVSNLTEVTNAPGISIVVDIP